MRNVRRELRIGRVLGALAGVLAFPPWAAAQPNPVMPRPDFSDLEVTERVGEQLPLHAEFKNSKGETVRLGDYFKDGKPAIIAMVYYRCPVVCGVILDKLTQCMNRLDYQVGKDFRCLVFSFDPSETAAAADAKKSRYTSGYVHGTGPEVMAGWEFHVGTEVASRELAQAIGFNPKKLDNGEYSHPTAIYVVTPEGKISRYIFGLDYPPRDIKLSLLDATSGKIAASLGDKLLHFCFRFDPNTGRSVLVAFRVMQLGAAATAVLVGVLIGALVLGERVRKSRSPVAAGMPEANPARGRPMAAGLK